MCVVVVVKKDRKKELHWGSSSEGLNALLVVRCADCSYTFWKNETSGLASCEDSEGSSDKSSPSPSRGVGASAPQLQAKKGKKFVSLYIYMYYHNNSNNNKKSRKSKVIRAVIPPISCLQWFLVEPQLPQGWIIQIGKTFFP